MFWSNTLVHLPSYIVDVSYVNVFFNHLGHDRYCQAWAQENFFQDNKKFKNFKTFFRTNNTSSYVKFLKCSYHNITILIIALILYTCYSVFLSIKVASSYKKSVGRWLQNQSNRNQSSIKIFTNNSEKISINLKKLKCGNVDREHSQCLCLWLRISTAGFDGTYATVTPSF